MNDRSGMKSDTYTDIRKLLTEWERFNDKYKKGGEFRDFIAEHAKRSGIRRNDAVCVLLDIGTDTWAEYRNRIGRGGANDREYLLKLFFILRLSFLEAMDIIGMTGQPGFDRRSVREAAIASLLVRGVHSLPEVDRLLTEEYGEKPLFDYGKGSAKKAEIMSVVLSGHFDIEKIREIAGLHGGTPAYTENGTPLFLYKDPARVERLLGDISCWAAGGVAPEKQYCRDTVIEPNPESLRNFVQDQLDKNGLRKQALLEMLDISDAVWHGYLRRGGRGKAHDRDMLFKLCFLLRLDAEQINRFFEITGLPGFELKNMREFIIHEMLKNRWSSPSKIDDALSAMNLTPLFIPPSREFSAHLNDLIKKKGTMRIGDVIRALNMKPREWYAYISRAGAGGPDDAQIYQRLCDLLRLSSDEATALLEHTGLHKENGQSGTSSMHHT